MKLKWRFSGGVIFSLILHFSLSSALLYWYPGMIDRSGHTRSEWSDFLAKRILYFGTDRNKAPETSPKKSTTTLFFPDIVLHKKLKKPQLIPQIKKKSSKPKLSFKNILSQIEKFPERLKISRDSKKQFSRPVTSLLTLFSSVSLQSQISGNGTGNLNSVGLLNYHKKLKDFLSERWIVPINLIGSTNIVVIQFEINKDGRIIKYYREGSGNNILYKSVKNLMKNLQFLPSLPKSYQEDSYNFGIRFSPANFKE